MLRLLTLCLVACLVGKCQSQCDVLEGSNGTWTSYPQSKYPNGTANFTELTWTLSSGNSTTILSQCSPSGSCTNNYAPTFVASLTDRYSILNAINVTRNLPFSVEGSLKCSWAPSFTNLICNTVYVIAKASSLSCVLLQVNNTSAYVNCTVERSYPSNTCSLQVSRDNVSFTSYNSAVTISMAATTETPAYFSGTCQMSLTDRFYLGTNYLRGVAFPSAYYSYKYFVYGKPFVYKTVFGEVTTPTSSESNYSPSSAAGATSSASESGAVIGLAVATGIFGFVVAALAILIIVFWLRNKKKTNNTKTNRTTTEMVPPKIAPKPTSLPIPEGYNRVVSSQLNPDDNYYEEVTKPKTTSSGANPNRLKHSTPDLYANSGTENSPNTTTNVAVNTKRLVQQLGMYTNSRKDKNRIKGLFRGTKKQQPTDSHIEENYVNVEEYVNPTS